MLLMMFLKKMGIVDKIYTNNNNLESSSKESNYF